MPKRFNAPSPGEKITSQFLKSVAKELQPELNGPMFAGRKVPSKSKEVLVYTTEQFKIYDTYSLGRCSQVLVSYKNEEGEDPITIDTPEVDGGAGSYQVLCLKQCMHSTGDVLRIGYTGLTAYWECCEHQTVCYAKVVEQSEDHATQQVVKMKMCRIRPVKKNEEDENEYVEPKDLEVGQDVEVAVQDEVEFFALNPRIAFLNEFYIYPCYRMGKFWVIDNQSAFTDYGLIVSGE